MKGFLTVKFPCGYEYMVRAEQGLFEFGYMAIDAKTLPLCPLHGRDCIPL